MLFICGEIQTGSDGKYFLADHLGSTNALTDASGAILEQTAYDSFGNATNNLSTRYQFTGREFDNFTSLHYYRARFYDAQIGRFISEDPIGFAGGGVNLFAYVWNIPQRYTDPFGLQRKEVNQPALWDRARKQPQIDRGLQQPQFQRIENLNPDTSNSWWDWITGTIWDRGKFCFGELSTGSIPGGGYKASVPGMGEAITTLEMGPELYNTTDLIKRRNHDINDALRCANGGKCDFTEYDPQDGFKDKSKNYEDLSLWEKTKCTFWGTCPSSGNR